MRVDLKVLGRFVVHGLASEYTCSERTFSICARRAIIMLDSVLVSLLTYYHRRVWHIVVPLHKRCRCGQCFQARQMRHSCRPLLLAPGAPVVFTDTSCIDMLAPSAPIMAENVWGMPFACASSRCRLCLHTSHRQHAFSRRE